jgi:hypothetical protein
MLMSDDGHVHAYVVATLGWLLFLMLAAFACFDRSRKSKDVLVLNIDDSISASAPLRHAVGL